MMNQKISVEQARNLAKKYMKEHADNPAALRSCWECNSAHEHLKTLDIPLNCFDCGKWFYKGIDITITDKN